MDDDPLAEWRDMLLERFLFLRDEDLPEDLTLDFTVASLRGLETVAAQRLDEEEFVLAAAAYLGETLMRAGGGAWEWIDDRPVVRPDDALGLEPVSPVDLVEAAGDQSFEAAHAAWATAAARVAAQRPAWRPDKEQTDLDLLDDLDADALTRWLTARESAFAGGAGFDFSPESLTTLEETIRAAAATEQELRAPEHRELLDSAIWYYGEVVRRRLGGTWTYDAPGRVDTTEVYLRGVGPSRGRIVPAMTIFNTLVRPGHLRSKYDSFAGR